MNTGTVAVQLPEKEYINGIFVKVRSSLAIFLHHQNRTGFILEKMRGGTLLSFCLGLTSYHTSPANRARGGGGGRPAYCDPFTACSMYAVYTGWPEAWLAPCKKSKFASAAMCFPSSKSRFLPYYSSLPPSLPIPFPSPFNLPTHPPFPPSSNPLYVSIRFQSPFLPFCPPYSLPYISLRFQHPFSSSPVHFRSLPYTIPSDSSPVF